MLSDVLMTSVRVFVAVSSAIVRLDGSRYVLRSLH